LLLSVLPPARGTDPARQLADAARAIGTTTKAGVVDEPTMAI
jgi:hypothetical protein